MKKLIEDEGKLSEEITNLKKQVLQQQIDPYYLINQAFEVI